MNRKQQILHRLGKIRDALLHLISRARFHTRRILTSIAAQIKPAIDRLLDLELDRYGVDLQAGPAAPQPEPGQAAPAPTIRRGPIPPPPAAPDQPAEPAPPTQSPPRLPYEPELLFIPAGEFLLGQWRRTEHLPAYYIARTPVTNLQYRHFVIAGGPRPAHWRGTRIPSPKQHHPVVGVTWEDAEAYCRWLSKVTGKTYRLPTEHEWEKAARGCDGREYPWGDRWQDGLCNTEEAQRWDTTPVGKYSPRADSPYGCVDMAGNVWEWTSSWFDGSRADRVVRGGAWDRLHSYARCIYQLVLAPGDSNHSVGFRCVSPIDDR